MNIVLAIHQHVDDAIGDVEREIEQHEAKLMELRDRRALLLDVRRAARVPDAASSALLPETETPPPGRETASIRGVADLRHA